jgi:hypothetical protein
MTVAVPCIEDSALEASVPYNSSGGQKRQWPFAIQTLQGHICAWRGQIGTKAIFKQICKRYCGWKCGEIIGLSSYCGRRIDLETIDTRNGNQDRCHL